jgi:hypothetical protein
MHTTNRISLLESLANDPITGQRSNTAAKAKTPKVKRRQS